MQYCFTPSVSTMVATPGHGKEECCFLSTFADGDTNININKNTFAKHEFFMIILVVGKWDLEMEHVHERTGMSHFKAHRDGNTVAGASPCQKKKVFLSKALFVEE